MLKEKKPVILLLIMHISWINSPLLVCWIENSHITAYRNALPFLSLSLMKVRDFLACSLSFLGSQGRLCETKYTHGPTDCQSVLQEFGYFLLGIKEL